MLYVWLKLTLRDRRPEHEHATEDGSSRASRASRRGGKQRKERYAKRMGMLYMMDRKGQDLSEERGRMGWWWLEAKEANSVRYSFTSRPHAAYSLP